jgi:hypothetical protein
MHARIGVMQALNRNVESVFDSSHKTTQWGKRKQARDRDAADDGIMLNQKPLCVDLVHEDEWNPMRCFTFYCKS